MITCLLCSHFVVSFCRFVLLWFHNGSCSESDRPFSMGLQDIWWKRLQESHNHFQGTHQHLPFSWTLGHLIETYPLLANPVMVWHRVSVSLLWLFFFFFLIFVFSVNHYSNNQSWIGKWEVPECVYVFICMLYNVYTKFPHELLVYRLLKSLLA